MKTSEVHIGDKIGQLIVLDKTRKVTSGWNRTVFKCKCSCGNICYYPAMQLHPNKKCSNGVHRMRITKIKIFQDMVGVALHCVMNGKILIIFLIGIGRNQIMKYYLSQNNR